MNTWKKVNIDFPTIKLGDFIEPIRTTVTDLGLDNPVVYGVTNIEGITQTGKPASKDLGKYIALEKDCFAYNPYRINVGSIGINELNLQGCVSPAYVVFKTKNGLLPKFLFHYIKSEFGIHLINWYGNKGGVRNALRFDDLCKIDIPDITKLNQEEILTQLDEYKDKIQVILEEIESQKAYAKQLRQNILQDAIEGKLTAEWRKTHPVIKGNPDYDAEALFEEIQKEKKSDIKQKELAPISDDEKPFEIPDGWKWVTMGDIYSFSNGTASRGSANGRPYPVLRLADLSNNYIDLNDVRNINLTDNEFNSHRVFNDDLIFIRVNGSKDRVGNAFLFTSDNPVSYCDHLFCGHKISKFISSSFTMLEFNSSFARNQITPLIKTTTGQNTINQGNMSIIKLPFPPIEEQKEIVKRVNEDYKRINQLEQQISQREEYANQLMQSILKDAFEK